VYSTVLFQQQKRLSGYQRVKEYVLLINYSNITAKKLTTMAAPYKIASIPTTAPGAMFGSTVEVAVALWLVLD